MKHKIESLAYFKIIKAEVETTTTHRIKAVLRTDNGGKYASTEFNFFGSEHGIYCYLTHPETHTKTVRLNGAIAPCKILITRCLLFGIYISAPTISGGRQSE